MVQADSIIYVITQRNRYCYTLFRAIYLILGEVSFQIASFVGKRL